MAWQTIFVLFQRNIRIGGNILVFRRLLAAAVSFGGRGVHIVLVVADNLDNVAVGGVGPRHALALLHWRLFLEHFGAYPQGSGWLGRRAGLLGGGLERPNFRRLRRLLLLGF